MLSLLRAAFAMLVAMTSLVQVLAAPGSPSGTTKTTAGSVTTTAVEAHEPVPTPQGLSQIARFEDDVGNAVTGQSIDKYLNIYWQGMSLAMTEASLKKRYHPGYVPETPPNFGPAGAPNGPPDNGRGPPPTGPPTTPNYASGLVPNSPPNYASFSPKDPVTIQQGSPQMTTVYPDSTVASFNLHSFFYGCTTDKSLPASCDITITGFNLTDDQISEQTFTFEADGAEQQMREAVAEGFSNVKWVNFDIGPEDQEARAYIDSVDYEVFGLDS